LFGKEFKTLANIASVCRAFEPSRRREDLSWSHHAEAAALSPNAADMLLDLAERDRMSKGQVRAAVTTIRGGPPSRTAPDEAAVASLFRAYNRLSGEVRMLVAQAFAAANGAEIDPETGKAKAEPLPAMASDMAATPAEFDLDIALDLAPDTVAVSAESEFDTAFDLTPDMAALQTQAAPDTALDLGPEMETEEEEKAPSDRTEAWLQPWKQP
jgi:hypothetical protein